MNANNVAALAELLHEIIPNQGRALGSLVAPPKGGAASECLFCQDAAQRLAARGVLVPAALTDEETAIVGRAATDPFFGPLNCRTALEMLAQGAERLARGEDRT